MRKKFVPGILVLVMGLIIAGCGNKTKQVQVQERTLVKRPSLPQQAA